jgi:outer membrane protein OmpA-like peptidoglycan-associated protein
LLTGQEANGLSGLEDVIMNIAKVLTQTGALATNPVAGKENTLYYDKILSGLKDKNFHPGRIVSIKGVDNSAEFEAVRGVAELKVLTDEEWNKLMPVGQLRVEPISFGRGKSAIGIQGQRDLDELVNNLKAWPTFYLKIAGHASAQGDMEANMALAQSRADAVTEYLYAGGVSQPRIKSLAIKPLGENSQSFSVTFELGQLPY